MKQQRQYQVAAVQFEAEHSARENNIRRLEALARQAAQQGAQIIVMPEMATVGVFWQSREHIAPFVEPIPGPTTERFCALARELDVYIVVGLGEVDPATDIYYNSAILVGPEGLVGRHRKVHGYLSDPMWAADGNLGFQTWETPLGKLGIMICMDANYPESGRLLALNDADVILMPVGWVVETCPAPLWINRAFDNGLSAVCANRRGIEVGNQFSGGSTIINPDGSIQKCLTRGDRDEIVMGGIDLDDPRRGHFSADPAATPITGRRPELYGALALNRYLWNPEVMHANFGANPLPDGTRFKAVVCQPEQPQTIEVITAQLAEYSAGPAGGLPSLFVLPEVSFNLFPRSREAAKAIAEGLDGPTVTRLKAWCAQSGSYIVAGLVEADGTNLYNTLVLVGPGKLYASYRKTHLGEPDAKWATPGDRLVWADTPVGRIGLLAGTDLLYMEPVRCLAINGVDAVCVSAALAGPAPIYRRQLAPAYPEALHWHFARTRAAENDVYVLFANRCDQFMGNSAIFFGPILFGEPAREALVEMSPGAAVGMAELEIDTRTQPGNYLRAKPGLCRRLTAYYAPLLAPVR